MRFEDKLIEGPELARDERQRADELHKRHDELTELEPKEATVGHGAEDVLLTALGAILAHRRVGPQDARLDPEKLALPEREQRALAALQDAVRGREHHREAFLFAEDRRDLLEQALAVLQPSLRRGAGHGDALRDPYEHIVERVGELRESLGALTDAQEQLEQPAGALGKGSADGGETDDKDDKDDKPGDKPDKDAKPRASTLTGPALPDEPPRPSTLGDAPTTRSTPATPATPAAPTAPTAPAGKGNRRG